MNHRSVDMNEYFTVGSPLLCTIPWNEQVDVQVQVSIFICARHIDLNLIFIQERKNKLKILREEKLKSYDFW